jgi:hypothetical protein
MVVLGVLAALAGGGFRAALAHASALGVRVTTSPATRPLADGFLGLALEYSTIPQWVGTGSQPVNPVLVRLIRNLDPVGRPVLRIGGQSTDRTWWPVPGMSRPLGVSYNLTSAWAKTARSLAQSVDARLLLGINLEANRTRIDQVEAAQLLKGIGRDYVDALEIGNEPALYPLYPWYRRLGGRPLPWYSQVGTPVYARGPGYGPAQYTAEIARTLKVVPRLPVAGPGTGAPAWLASFSHFLSPGSQVRMLTSHAYGLDQCVTDRSLPRYPSVAHLLSLSASRGLLDGVAPYVTLAHGDGATYRIDEMGSITCNGRAGVSNTMASALWVMDALFSIAAANIDGVNLHTYPNSANGLFDFKRSRGRWEGTVHPLYYGVLMFAQAAPAGSRLLRIDTGSQDQLRVWATLGPDRRIRVLLINDSLKSEAQTLVHLPVGYGSRAGSIERLLAPSAYATSGITLGDQHFGATTATGVLPPPAPETVTPHLGAYAVTLPVGSAALLMLQPR